MGMCYKPSFENILVGFCDTNYVGDKLERKNANENYTFFGDNLISWSNKRHCTISLYTTEVEYISTTSCNNQQL